MKTNRRTLRNIILFCFVAIICGWGGVGIDMLLGEPSNMESLGALIFISSPILCMILLRLFGGDGWKDLPLKPNFKQNTRWYLFAITVYPVVIGITLSIGKLFGWIDVSKFSFSAYLPILIAAFLPEFIKRIGVARLSHSKNGATHQKRMVSLFSCSARMADMASAILPDTLRRRLFSNILPLWRCIVYYNQLYGNWRLDNNVHRDFFPFAFTFTGDFDAHDGRLSQSTDFRRFCHCFTR